MKFIHHWRGIYINPVFLSYLIKVGLGLGEDAKGSFVLFNLSC